MGKQKFVFRNLWEIKCASRNMLCILGNQIGVQELMGNRNLCQVLGFVVTRTFRVRSRVPQAVDVHPRAGLRAVGGGLQRGARGREVGRGVQEPLPGVHLLRVPLGHLLPVREDLQAERGDQEVGAGRVPPGRGQGSAIHGERVLGQ